MAQFQFDVDVSGAIANLQKLIAQGEVTGEKLSAAIKSGIKPIEFPPLKPMEVPSGFLDKFKDAFTDVGKSAAGFITGGLAIGGIMGLGEFVKSALNKGLEKIESFEGLKLGLRQAKLEGEALENEVKRIGDKAVVMANQFAVSPAEVRRIASSVAFLGGQAGESNDRITKLALGIQEASKAAGTMVGANMVVRLFTRGLNDPEAVANLGRLKMMFPGLATALKDVTKPAEMATKAMEYLGPTFAALEEKAKGPAGSLKKLENATTDLEATAGSLLVEGITPVMQALAQGAIWLKENVIPVFQAFGKEVAQNKDIWIAFGIALTYAFAPWLAAIGLVVGGVVMLREALDDSADARMKEVKAQDEMLKGAIKEKETLKAQAEGFDKLADSYKTLGEKTNRTTAEQKEFEKATLAINDQYPDTIKGGEDFQVNLDNVSTAAQKAKVDVGELTANLSALSNQEQELGKYKLNLDVDVAKETVEKTLADATGGVVNKLTELAFGTSTARHNAEEFIQPFADMVYKAATSSQLLDAQTAFVKALDGAGLEKADRQKSLAAFQEFVNKKKAVIGQAAADTKIVAPKEDASSWADLKNAIDMRYAALKIQLTQKKLAHLITQEELNKKEAENEVAHQSELIAAATKSQDVGWEVVSQMKVKRQMELLKLDKINADQEKKQNESTTAADLNDLEKRYTKGLILQKDYDKEKAEIQLNADQKELEREAKYNDDLTAIQRKITADKLALFKLDTADDKAETDARRKQDDKEMSDERTAKIKHEEALLALMTDGRKKEVAKENFDNEQKVRAIWDAAGKEIQVDLDLYNKKLILRADYINRVNAISARAHVEEIDQLNVHAKNLFDIQRKESLESEIFREDEKVAEEKFYGWIDDTLKRAGVDQNTLWGAILNTTLKTIEAYLSKRLAVFLTELAIEKAANFFAPVATGLAPSNESAFSKLLSGGSLGSGIPTNESAFAKLLSGAGVAWGGVHKEDPGVWEVNQPTMFQADPNEIVAIIKKGGSIGQRSPAESTNTPTRNIGYAPVEDSVLDAAIEHAGEHGALMAAEKATTWLAGHTAGAAVEAVGTPLLIAKFAADNNAAYMKKQNEEREKKRQEVGLDVPIPEMQLPGESYMSMKNRSLAERMGGMLKDKEDVDPSAELNKKSFWDSAKGVFGEIGNYFSAMAKREQLEMAVSKTNLKEKAFEDAYSAYTSTHGKEIVNPGSEYDPAKSTPTEQHTPGAVSVGYNETHAREEFRKKYDAGTYLDPPLKFKQDQFDPENPTAPLDQNDQFFGTIEEHAAKSKDKIEQVFYGPLRNEAAITAQKSEQSFDLGFLKPIGGLFGAVNNKAGQLFSGILGGVQTVTGAMKTVQAAGSAANAAAATSAATTGAGITAAMTPAATVTAIATGGVSALTAVGAIASAVGAILAIINLIHPMKEGGSGTVTGPTLFLAGEAGDEHFEFNPVRKMSSHNVVTNANNSGPSMSRDSGSGTSVNKDLKEAAMAMKHLHTKIETVTTVSGKMVADGDQMYSAIAHSTLTSQLTRA